MSLKATVWAWSQKLRPSHKLVLLKLSDRANQSNFCFPSIQSLVNDTGLDRKTVFSAIKTLKEQSLIFVKKGYKGRANIYHLKIDSGKNGTYPIPKTELNTSPKTVHQSNRESNNKSYNNKPTSFTDKATENLLLKQYEP